MSVTNGPNADNAAKVIRKNALFFIVYSAHSGRGGALGKYNLPKGLDWNASRLYGGSV